MQSQTMPAFSPVYGPVTSWRYGTSLGIDPIGLRSTCSFNCVYCQLGEIENHTAQRGVYVPTGEILADLKDYAPWLVDVITLSGSGEPTLASNLGDILGEIKTLTHCPTLVLTNGTLLGDPEVCEALGQADQVSVKVDGLTDEAIQRVNRPVAGFNFQDFVAGLQGFRGRYQGKLGVQTMVLMPWSASMIEEYSQWMKALGPDEIQLNTPTRPKPQQRQLEGRGNHRLEDCGYPVQRLKCVPGEILSAIASQVAALTDIPVKSYPLT
ncbi:radical SAM protein [Spirulina subsalsa FACHB-351]|uniref:Radical SAM protein n=1 Tax=Spirulina subsalsa FACHB-351 TaxID=234711 RepID=A0ABT3L9N9_9CYAN|nr:radical SAM protein [Spirulina subsalsa]MCW6037690.1 radical SAM protein [Spirulina subsalsa FACHB-351]